ncbi:hypothetical protein [Candidatus Minimicrobia vallesae]|nr:hypothetical protein [Candidatus Minimicrobia vallesae]
MELASEVLGVNGRVSPIALDYTRLSIQSFRRRLLLLMVSTLA